MTENEAQPPLAGARKRRRGRRLWIGAALTLGAVAVAAPPLASRVAKGRIEAAGSEAIDGTVRVGSVRIAWNGKVALDELSVEDADGALVVGVDTARFDLGLRSLATGKKDVTLIVDGFHVDLARGADGAWNVAGLAREGATTGDADDAPGAGPPDTPPDLEGRIQLRGGSIVLRDERRALQLVDVLLQVGLDGDAREYTIDMSARILGGDGSAGDFALDAALWPDVRPGVRVDSFDVTGFEVGVVTELLAILGMPLGEGSTLSGEVDLELAGRIDGFDADAPVRIEGRGEGRDLLVDLFSDGARTARFGDEVTTLEFEAARPADAPPTANLRGRARDGKLTLDAAWDAGASEGLRADVVVDGLSASAGLEPLLARVHPVFAGARAIDGAGVDGLVSTSASVVYAAPLPLEALAGGWDALDKGPFSGSGELSVAEGIVETSPFFDQLLSALEREGAPRFDLSPLRFAVAGGRLRYTDPWTWTIDGAETRFEGSVGLDGSLELNWDVPIVAGLARTNRVFEALEGESLRLGLGGTLTSPSLDVAGALRSLALRAAEKEAKSRLGDEVGRVIGGGVNQKIDEEIRRVQDDVEEATRGLLGGGDAAQELLRRADELWDSGERAEAAKLYRKIRSDHRLSPVYLLNKSRIKKRRKG